MLKFTLLLLAAALAAPAQTEMTDVLAHHWKTSGEFTLAVAASMPADGYTFRPSPEEMNFGQLMAHIAAANNNACSLASGLPRVEPSAKIAEWMKAQQKTDVDKAAAMDFLRDTFALCEKAAAAMTPERLHAVQGPPARHLTGFEWLWSYFTHTAHHRGQAEVYLRVKGIKPPGYQF